MVDIPHEAVEDEHSPVLEGVRDRIREQLGRKNRPLTGDPTLDVVLRARFVSRKTIGVPQAAVTNVGWGTGPGTAALEWAGAKGAAAAGPPHSAGRDHRAADEPRAGGRERAPRRLDVRLQRFPASALRESGPLPSRTT